MSQKVKNFLDPPPTTPTVSQDNLDCFEFGNSWIFDGPPPLTPIGPKMLTKFVSDPGCGW